MGKNWRERPKSKDLKRRPDEHREGDMNDGSRAVSRKKRAERKRGPAPTQNDEAVRLSLDREMMDLRPSRGRGMDGNGFDMAVQSRTHLWRESKFQQNNSSARPASNRSVRASRSNGNQHVDRMHAHAHAQSHTQPVPVQSSQAGWPPFNPNVQNSHPHPHTFNPHVPPFMPPIMPHIHNHVLPPFPPSYTTPYPYPMGQTPPMNPVLPFTPLTHVNNVLPPPQSPFGPESAPSRARSTGPFPAPPKRPIPEEKYLAQASLEPTTLDSPRRLLIILDLNGTLVWRKRAKYPVTVVERPGLNVFLQNLYENYSVMVWSSARPRTVASIVDQVVPSPMQKTLVATWARDKLGLTNEQYDGKVQVYKQLTKVWDTIDIQAKHPDRIGLKSSRSKDPSQPAWDQTNTILIDDSRLKASSHPHNIIEIPEFLGAIKLREEKILRTVMRQLQILARQGDVSRKLRQWAKKLSASGLGADEFWTRQLAEDEEALGLENDLDPWLDLSAAELDAVSPPKTANPPWRTTKADSSTSTNIERAARADVDVDVDSETDGGVKLDTQSQTVQPLTKKQQRKAIKAAKAAKRQQRSEVLPGGVAKKIPVAS